MPYTNQSTPEYKPLSFSWLDTMEPGQCLRVSMKYYTALGSRIGWRKVRDGKTFGRRKIADKVWVWRLT
jgi:hypothetical protein